MPREALRQWVEIIEMLSRSPAAFDGHFVDASQGIAYGDFGKFSRQADRFDFQ